MNKLNLIVALSVAGLLVGCGSSEPAAENVAPAPQATAPAPTTVQDPNSGATTTNPTTQMPENSGGTPIKANELGPQ